MSHRFVAAGHKAAPGTGARRDKVAELATENAALRGHIRTLILAGEALIAQHADAYAIALDETDDLKAAIDAAKLAK